MRIDRGRVQQLQALVSGLTDREDRNGEARPDGKALYEQHKEQALQVTPHEVLELFHIQLQSGRKAADLLTSLDKVFNMFYKGLKAYAWDRPARDSFLDVLMQENQAMLSKLDEIRHLLMQDPAIGNRIALSNAICALQSFDDHYVKKENILFPYLEKKHERFDGLTIMWALHDQARRDLKKTIDLLEENGDEASLKVAIGDLFFSMHGLALKEELILFPAACDVIEAEEWNEMERQSMEYSFPFIQRPAAPVNGGNHHARSSEALYLRSETGTLDLEQVQMLFDALPVDLSFVDEENKVRFFTRPKERIFPRSPAVIGRDVKNCHPPESVGVVLEIIEAFRSGRQESATFWIQRQERMILIRYFAVRDIAGHYRGTLEVSQDITDARQLTGERRLLQWDS